MAEFVFSRPSGLSSLFHLRAEHAVEDLRLFQHQTGPHMNRPENHTKQVCGDGDTLRRPWTQGMTPLLALLGLLSLAAETLADDLAGPDYCDDCSAVSEASGLDGHLWCQADYLLWWMRSCDVPALVTTSVAGTSPNAAGVLGLETTQVLFGGDRLAHPVHPGGGIRLGWWFDDCQSQGLEIGYAGLAGRNSGFAAASATVPILARPFLDLTTGQQGAMLVAHPDFLEGAVDVDLESSWQSFGLAYRQSLLRHCRCRIDWLIGWRFARLDDVLRITQSSRYTAPQGQIVAGTTKEVRDVFDSENEFQGGEIGFVYHDRRGCWTGELMLRVALGGAVGRVGVHGGTTTTVPGAGTATFDGGLLAQTTNEGFYREDGFAVLPELAVKLGYELHPGLRLSVGYGLVALSRVLRAADQVDLSMSQLPPEPPTGSMHPQFPASTRAFWAQGLQFGLEYAF